MLRMATVAVAAPAEFAHAFARPFPQTRSMLLTVHLHRRRQIGIGDLLNANQASFSKLLLRSIYDFLSRLFLTMPGVTNYRSYGKRDQATIYLYLRDKDEYCEVIQGNN